MKRVMVFGTFDLLHKGHLNMFEQAKAHGDYLIVVVARDQRVAKIKGHLVTYSELERLLVVKQASIVDESLLGGEADPYQVIREKKPDVICLGYDQNNFTANLAEAFPDIKIVRLKSYKPEIYKSSKLKG